ncbi:MAG: hypothetical protein ABL892_13815 [Thiobacillaceae bacterium]
MPSASRECHQKKAPHYGYLTLIDPEESLENLKPPAAWRRIADAGIQRGYIMSLGRGLDDPRETVRYGAESTVSRSSLSILLAVLGTEMASGLDTGKIKR